VAQGAGQVGAVTVQPGETDGEASGGPARPAALVETSAAAESRGHFDRRAYRLGQQTLPVVPARRRPLVGLPLVALLLIALLACSQGAVDRAEWQRMNQHDRLLYVKSLLGAEQAKDAKGGRGRTYDHPAEDYVKKIDEAYARGDAREVSDVFAELAR
jgi:hypothetical protein